ncbi:MAG: DNA mismatch repair endonuclease MutL, partial [Deltaproteobacteria bacterium]|nr:DNA mismatch repair endonuclease MutL [Deltaproteobacteria bacterium]
MGRIRQLSPELADKIAAGEVVERPASVVKELVENSLDAGASRIQVAVEGGGLKLITVRDNGQGMDPDDALLALKRHATSKIKDEADLFRVTSLGFRGEALPAMASVSRLSLTTHSQKAAAATRIEVEGGLIQGSAQTSGPRGTTVEVRDLFYNTPARLKFLKTSRTETAWIKEAVIRLGLARHDVYFQFKENQRASLTLLPVKRAQDRLADLFGPEAAANLIFVEENHPAVRVWGWISPPEESRSSSRSVYTFVNQRFIRDRIVLGGLLSGLEGRLDRGRYPLSVLFLELEPGTLDVNVHPAKLEARFHHAQAVHLAVKRAVSQALGTRDRFIWTVPQDSRPPLAVAEKEARFGPSPPSASVRQPWDRFSGQAAGDHPHLETQAEPLPQTPLPHRFRFLGQYSGVYLVGQAGDDLVLIDQHAAHERILYDKFKTSPGQSQPLLTAQKITLAPIQAESLSRHLEAASSLGLALEPFGPDGLTFVVKALPALVAGFDPAKLVKDLADELVSSQSGPSLDSLEMALARLACHQAVRAGQDLSPEEV